MEYMTLAPMRGEVMSTTILHTRYIIVLNAMYREFMVRNWAGFRAVRYSNLERNHHLIIFLKTAMPPTVVCTTTPYHSNVEPWIGVSGHFTVL
jgi:hypothetical protein